MLPCDTVSHGHASEKVSMALTVPDTNFNLDTDSKSRKTGRHHRLHPRETVRNIFVWIARNIEYDVDRYLRHLTSPSSAALTEDSADEVLGRRKACCRGYAALFEALCGRAEIACVTIPGWAKGHGYLPGDRFDPGLPNHAWNAAYLDGRWQLLDCCWGAGYVSSTDGKYRPRLELHYLFTPPRAFVRDHLPCDPSWQLLEETLSMETFLWLPLYRPLFYKRKLSARMARTSDCPSECFLVINHSQPARFHATLTDYRSRVIIFPFIPHTRVSFSASIFHMRLPFVGTFVVTVYCSAAAEGRLQGTADDKCVVFSLAFQASSLGTTSRSHFRGAFVIDTHVRHPAIKASHIACTPQLNTEHSDFLLPLDWELPGRWKPKIFLIEEGRQWEQHGTGELQRRHHGDTQGLSIRPRKAGVYKIVMYLRQPKQGSHYQRMFTLLVYFGHTYTVP